MGEVTYTRMIIFILIGVYLVGLGFLIPTINKTIGDNAVSYKNESQQITDNTQEFTFITSITSLPLWFNTIFIIIPFVIFILIGITLFFPTGNAGA